MPLYDYHCTGCGPFRAWRSMHEAREPAPCPDCESPGARAVAAPNLALMASSRRTAHQRNEKSAHEPRLESRAERPSHGHQHQHGHGGHGHHHHHHTATRPWMIGH